MSLQFCFFMRQGFLFLLVDIFFYSKTKFIKMSLESSFEGRSVLITGGGRGIGRALVKLLTEYKANVYVLEKNTELVEKLKKDFPHIRAEVADISNWNETQRLIHSFGPMDHVVNNAAIIISQALMDVTEASFTAQVDVNLKGLYCVTQAAVKEMIKCDGSGRSIVNIASTASIMAFENGSIYSTLKAALVMFTKSMAYELGRNGIRVNCISPTGVNTDMLAGAALPESVKQIFDRQPLAGKTVMEAEEVAKIILFLLSPLSSLTNGHNYVIDGGITIC